MMKGDWDGALADYNRAIEIDPKLAAAHLNLGFVLIEKGKPDDAVSELKTAAA